jgi:DNA-binding HxlR family transcriptional regulator
MQHGNGPGGRRVDLTLLRALEDTDTGAVSTSELAGRLTSPAGTIASKLRALVKAELVQRHWGAERGAARTYALTDAGRQFLLSLSAA